MEFDLPRYFVGGQVSAAILANILGLELFIAADDLNLDRFAVDRVMHAEDLTGDDIGMLLQDAFDFLRIDIKTRDQDHPLFPAHDLPITGDIKTG